MSAIDERILTDADCEKIAELVVPKLKASIMGDVQREAGKGLFSLTWKAFLTVLLILAIYNLTGSLVSFKTVSAKIGANEPVLHGFQLPPPNSNDRHLLRLARRLDALNRRDGA